MERVFGILICMVIGSMLGFSLIGIYLCLIEPFQARKKSKKNEENEPKLITDYSGYEFLSDEGQIVMLDAGDIIYTGVIRTDLNSLEQVLFSPGLFGNGQGYSLSAFRDKYPAVMVRDLG